MARALHLLPTHSAEVAETRTQNPPRRLWAFFPPRIPLSRRLQAHHQYRHLFLRPKEHAVEAQGKAGTELEADGLQENELQK